VHEAALLANLSALASAAARAPVKDVSAALDEVKALFRATGAPFKLVGGLAVVHHGYRRLTEDIDVLLDPAALPTLASLASQHGCSVVSRTRLRHDASGVDVDLLVAGDPLPRVQDGTYPALDQVQPSPRDSDFVALPSLVALKLRAHRHQDIADVVELLKLRSDAEYLELESQIPVALRPTLARLRDDALEELRGV